MTVQPEATGASERVRAYIADAYAWELEATPPRPPELDRLMQDALQTGKATGRIPQSDAIVAKMQERGKAMLSTLDDTKESLKILGDKHWVGNEYQHELGSLRTPPKHDPSCELVIEARILADGVAEVVTEVQTGQDKGIKRNYRVENTSNGWRIRTYTETFPNGG